MNTAESYFAYLAAARLSALRLLILVAATLAAGSTAAQSAGLYFEEYEEGGQYVLMFYDHRPATLAWFDARGLQGGGYTWEGLVTISLALEPPDPVYSPVFDPEADTFFAYLDSAQARSELRGRIERLVNDVEYREKCVAAAGRGGYLE